MEDYESAALRHFKDAKTLEGLNQLDNAGHLAGFAAECAIKFRIQSLRDGTSPHGHFPDLLVAARKHLGQRSNFTSMFDVLKGDAFKGWSVNRRYYATGHTNAEELTGWFTTTKRLFATANLRDK